MTTNTTTQTNGSYATNETEYSVPTPESMFKYARVDGENFWMEGFRKALNEAQAASNEFYKGKAQ